MDYRTPHFKTVDDFKKVFWEWVDWKASHFIFTTNEEVQSWGDFYDDWVVFDAEQLTEKKTLVIIFKTPYYLARSLEGAVSDLEYDIGGAEYDEEQIKLAKGTDVKAYRLGFNDGLRRAAQLTDNILSWEND